jgi:hypothetical protein
MGMRDWTTAVLFAAGTILAATFTGTSGLAQVPSQKPVPRTEQTVNLTMEQRHVIKEIIVKDMKIAPQTTEAPAKIGDTVPSGVTPAPIPVEVANKVPQLKTHSFFVKDGTVVIVDPKNNKVAERVE